jgi:protein O-mannosyl-transferase
MFNRKIVSHKYASPARSETAISLASPLGAAVGAVLIAFTVFITYIPCLSGGFVLDDALLMVDNPLIQSQDGLYGFWCTTQPTDFWPATSTTFWIEWRLWKTCPGGCHITNLILHVVESLLIWIILRRLNIPGAFFAALIFAVHPVNVESVAWISQRKNIMGMLFFLLSILWYIKAGMPTASVGMAPAFSSRHTPCAVPAHGVCGLHSNIYYSLSLAAFVLAMLGKGSTAVLPVLLLGIVWWLRPLERRDLARISPFFAVAAVLSGVNVWFQTHGAEIVIRSANYPERLLGAGGVVWFYLYKAILPVDLAFVYRQWHIKVGNPLWWLPLVAALAVTAVLWRYRQTWARPLLFAWGFFCVALAPVIGFTDVGFMQYSLVADHYQHIAIIGVIALAAAFWSLWRQSMRKKLRWAATLAAVAAAGSLTLLACQQSAIYRDAVTFYRTALVKNPDCWMAHNNLGETLFRSGSLQEALDHYGQALRLKPDYPDAHYNLGVLLSKTGYLPEAIEHYKKSIRLKSNYLGAYNNLGNALTNLGRTREAIEQLEQALRLKPDYAEAHNNLAAALAQSGRLQEALEHYGQALRLKSDYPEAHNNLGSLLSETGHLPEAIEHYQQAIHLQPDYPEAHNNLGKAFTDQGRTREAIEQFQEALRLKPDYADAHNNLGVVLVQKGNLIEAIEHFKQAVLFKPDYINPYKNLALVYAMLKQPSQAVAAAQKALEIARSQEQAAEAAQIENWLNSYRAAAPDEPNPPSPSNSAAPTP